MYQDFLAVGLDAVQGARDITMKYFGTNEETIKLGEKEVVDRTNKHFNNPATIADEQAESYIKNHIKKHFPDHGFLGEEEGRENLGSPYTWIIDPIDGTKAYARGMDDRSILLALQKDGEIVLGISCMPVINELVWATKGGGCFCNGKICRVSDRVMSDAFLSHERYKYFQREGVVDQLESVRSSVKYYLGAKTSRWFHYLVQGKVEMILGPTNMYLYDIAPYIVMVPEAGGMFTTLTGESVNQERTSFLASNGVFHDEVVGVFS